MPRAGCSRASTGAQTGLAAAYDGRPGLYMQYGYVYLPLAVGCAGLIGLALTLPASSLFVRLLNLRVLRYTGKISYGLYLWHRPLMRAFTESGLGGVPWAVAAMFGLSIGLALLSRRLIENPFLRLKDRYFSSPATAARSADPSGRTRAAPTSKKLIS